jgi:hypothetical protein
MTQQVGQPFTVSHIRLTTRHSLDVVSINEDDFDAAFEDIENRFPVNTGTLYRNVGAAFSDEPIRKAKQVIGHSREGTKLFLAMLDEASDYRLGMDVEATATRIEDLHSKLLWARA